MIKEKQITIGLTAHVDAGKTTLSEAMLYLSGELKSPGRVDHGSAFLDDDPIERQRGITIFSRQARFTIGKNEEHGQGAAEVTLIDTPGHVDFSAEMERSLWVLDYALLVISGSEGIQSHTKTLYRMLKERGIPVFVFVNKMDIAIKSKEEILESLQDELGMPAVEFSRAAERPEEFIDDVTMVSQSMAEYVLENMQDDTAEKSRGEKAADELFDEKISDAVLAGEIVPVMYGSALRIEGVSELLEVIGKYTKPPAYKDTFGAKVYKTMTDKTGEKLSFIKVTGGSLNVRDNVSVKSPAISGRSQQVTNENGKMPGVSDGSDVRKTAKINQIRLYSGNRFQTIDTAGAGMVCAVTGLGSVIPGTALGNEDPAADLSSEPFMIYSVIIPDGKDPHAVMGDMQTLSSEDPALCAEWSRDGSEILIRIMGEVQLQILQQIIRDRFGYEVGFGQGRVLYLETITDTYEGVGHFEPLRHYAEVHLIISPGERGSGIVITSDVAEDELALNWQRLIWTHLEEKEHTGVLTGAPLTDVHISIAAGKAHLKHTMGGDFREATYRAVRHAMMQAKRDGNMLLLEPWCEYEIELPAKDLGRAVTDIKQMGGIQSDLEQGEATAVIRGRVPSAKIEPYRQVLTGYTSGEGKLHVTQCGYDAACDADTVIEETGYDAEHDTANPADSVFVSHTGSDIVKWDEVFEHMHLTGVLKSGTRVENRYIADPREAARRRMAAEKDLQRIFEMTYGQAKPKRYIESKTVTAGEDDLSEEEAADRAARNEEIRAKHEKKSAPGDERPPLLLIDGYNLIFADEELKELSTIDAGSARDSLIERLVNYAGYTGMEVKLVFDAYKVAPGDGSTEKYSGVEVIFTAADELADVRIGRMADAAGTRRVYVVSSDRLVQQDVWTKGAMRISSREFLENLSRTEDEIRARLKM